MFLSSSLFSQSFLISHSSDLCFSLIHFYVSPRDGQFRGEYVETLPHKGDEMQWNESLSGANFKPALMSIVHTGVPSLLCQPMDKCRRQITFKGRARVETEIYLVFCSINPNIFRIYRNASFAVLFSFKQFYLLANICFPVNKLLTINCEASLSLLPFLPQPSQARNRV